MSDLVERLSGVRMEGTQELCWEAADRIEALEAQIAAADRLVEAAEHAQNWMYVGPVKTVLTDALAAYRAARVQP